MAERSWPTVAAVIAVGALLLSKCDGPVSTTVGAATVAGVGGVGVGVGIGAGAAGAGAAGAVKRGVSKRVEDTISGRNRPQNPRQPRTPTTQPTPSPSIPPTTNTTRPAPTPTTQPKADMAPDWCVQIEGGTCVTVKGKP